eukprot:6119843-Amphidinium_carterae.1
MQARVANSTLQACQKKRQRKKGYRTMVHGSQGEHVTRIVVDTQMVLRHLKDSKRDEDTVASEGLQRTQTVSITLTSSTTSTMTALATMTTEFHSNTTGHYQRLPCLLVVLH